jgi:pSer/pThr/pTyr-binding forkhead associated (FHA) protein
VREGNRFKLMNRSPNKTFVNGKPVEEGFLNEGDILMFAPDGPKVSFSTKIIESGAGIESTPSPSPPIDTEPPPTTLGYNDERSDVPSQPGSDRAQGVSTQKVEASLVIQFGPTLQSFNELPVSIGKNPACDFVLNHPAILDRHAMFLFGQDQYWVKDLTGQNLITINGQSIQSEAPMNPDDLLALSPQGPTFKFLGRGRLLEIE